MPAANFVDKCVTACYFGFETKLTLRFHVPGEALPGCCPDFLYRSIGNSGQTAEMLGSADTSASFPVVGDAVEPVFEVHASLLRDDLDIGCDYVAEVVISYDLVGKGDA